MESFTSGERDEAGSRISEVGPRQFCKHNLYATV